MGETVGGGWTTLVGEITESIRVTLTSGILGMTCVVVGSRERKGVNDSIGMTGFTLGDTVRESVPFCGSVVSGCPCPCVSQDANTAVRSRTSTPSLSLSPPLSPPLSLPPALPTTSILCTESILGV